MNVLSLFDGMSCGQVALERAGVRVENYFASEIDKYSIQIAQKNYPSTIQLGDITKWREWDLPKIDLIMGGSPCQGFSFAGKGLNFDDPRSKLFFEFVDCVKRLKPKYFLLENVKMKQEHQDVISQCLEVEPVLINSSLLTAQNRNRLYWTNIPGVAQPDDKGITWGDIRETGVNVAKYYYTDRAMQWIGRHSRLKSKLLRVHQDDEKMQMIEASHHKKYSSQRFFGIVDVPTRSECIEVVRGGNIFNATGDVRFEQDVKTNALSTTVGGNSVMPFVLEGKVPASEFFFRYITPLECEKCQTMPSNYTEGVSDTRRYMMTGNGWTVDVIAHIMRGIHLYSKI